jgi:integrase
LLRRAIQAYFNLNTLMPRYGAWLQTHYVICMPLPTKAEPRDRRLSDDEIRAIVNELESPELKAMVLFALLTTLRRSEIASLRWENVAFAKRTVRLLKPGHLKKTKTSTRDVPLLPATIKLLQDLGPQKSGPIFPCTASGLSQAWRRAADRAGMYDARLHDCRRESISRLIESCELSLESVVVFSGHSDLDTLQRHYVRLQPERIASKLAQLPGADEMIPRM